MSKETLIKSIRKIPDFPIPGILFYDVTTLFKNSEALKELSDILYDMYKDKGITKVVGIESRGFIMGAMLAARLGAGFVPIRKPGKLPAETIEESYKNNILESFLVAISFNKVDYVDYFSNLETKISNVINNLDKSLSSIYNVINDFKLKRYLELEKKNISTYLSNLKELEQSKSRILFNESLLKFPPLKGIHPFENFQKEDISRAIRQNRFLFNWQMGLG